MQIIYQRCCGLDIHKKVIMACLIICTEKGAKKETRTFGTMTNDLLSLLDWLKENGCEHVAMESTGVYWKPVYNLLEGEMQLSLVNAQHMKAVPGRKTDVKDAEWIADLLQHGLLKASFVPARPQRELRDLTRYRSALIADRARLVTRIHKILEDTNIKITAVLTDITGVSGRAILGALLAGETDSEALADLACGRLRGKRSQLSQAVQGNLHESHVLLLTTQLRHLDFLDQQIDQMDQAIAKRLGVPYTPRKKPRLVPGLASPLPSSDQDPTDAQTSLADAQTSLAAQIDPSDTQTDPSDAQIGPPDAQIGPPDAAGIQHGVLSEAEAIKLLDQIPGISHHLAQIIVAELGTDMSRFPTERHLASWAGLCPAAKISAGKRLSTKIGKGNVWLRQALIQAAHGAAHTKGTYLGAYYQRLSKRMGAKKAIVALAHRILCIIYHMLHDQVPFRELGQEHLEQKHAQDIKRWATKRLEQMGYDVTLRQNDAIAA